MRKGQYVLGHKWIYFIVALFLLTSMFLFSRSMYLNYQAEKITCTDAVINEVMIAKVLYSPDCFVYYDTELQRAVPGTIDGAKFTQARLDDCFTLITKDINLAIGGTTIGENMTNPKDVTKPIFLVTEGKTIPSTLTFTFEESAC